MILKQTDTKTSQLKILEKLLEESTSPTNLEELEDINGFGPVKVQEYGAAILEILKK
ncbi:HRDC domain-containing protein [Aliarcobacter butzleri]|uniref:HRDC domain-containing protein n=1 Tax=Aliarcobacter TaxID=2321111 RepID=UPI0021B36283|nr:MULTISPECIES: HRDC domain-containing protein [Aliarcobacter]MCT7520450.1 HRDC domain-containing protein [Aliarcobacter cryaerophilus]MCT7593815.1 HRDC domain-containing protein [Aliarcobacter butzleri]MCT7600381.1 HRDC domain-containing protein [Aliarcobacter butzleri]MCT7613579.1 HRDC domain-containing protein [Aliarcobacter butzleri]MCT7642199.1 HRDC domain-containing protein [Aliarcobacter butzleri]